ncbi:MAG: hypothetical protein QXD77_01490 [Candidatus Aenigmatarchaeota archaeon]
MASEWFEKTKKRIEAVKKKADGYKSGMETAAQFIKEAEETITKYEMVRTDAMTAKDEAERIIKYVKAEVKNAKEQAAKGAEQYREYLESKKAAAATAGPIIPSESDRVMPGYVLEQPETPKMEEPNKEPDISQLADKAVEGVKAKEPVPEKKDEIVYNLEVFKKANEAAVNVKAVTDRIEKQKDADIAEIERAYKDVSEQERMEREFQEQQYNEKKELEDKMTRALARYEVDRTSKIFEEMGKDDRDVCARFSGDIARLSTKLQEGKFDSAINDAYQVRKNLDEYKTAKAVQPVGPPAGGKSAAGVKMKKIVRMKGGKAKDRPAEKAGTQVAVYKTDINACASFCRDIAISDGFRADIVETVDGKDDRYEVNVIYDPQNRDDAKKIEKLKKRFMQTTGSVSKFAFTKEEYEALEKEKNTAPIIEALKSAGMVVEPGKGAIKTDMYRLKGGVPLAIAEALKKSAQKMVDMELVDAAKNGEPDCVVYRTDKKSFAEGVVTVLKEKEKINATLKQDTDNQFTVMIPAEVAKSKKFKSVEKGLKNTTGIWTGLEKDEYNAIMNAEGSRLKQILDGIIADGELENYGIMLTHYKLKNAPVLLTEYLKAEAMMVKNGAKPKEAEEQGILTDEKRVELYMKTDTDFLESVVKAERDGLDMAEAWRLRKESKELFNNGEYKAAMSMLVGAKKKLDDAIRRGRVKEPEAKLPGQKVPAEKHTEETKEPEEKPEKPVKIDVPKDVYEYLSTRPIAFTDEIGKLILTKTKEGKYFGYNFEGTKDEGKKVKEKIDSVKLDMKKAKQEFKEMQKKKKEEEKLAKELQEKERLLKEKAELEHEEENGKEEEEEAPKPYEEHPKPRIAKIRCPKCKEVIRVSSPKRPLEIRCSSCDAKLLMKK